MPSVRMNVYIPESIARRLSASEVASSAAVTQGLILYFDLDPETLEKKRPPLAPGQMVVDDAELAPFGAYVANDYTGKVFLVPID